MLEERLTRMLKCGTTTAEIKSGACHKHGMCCCLLIADTAWLSGYGLDVESEMKMLRVIHNVNKRHPVDCVATFCGAHAVPPDRTPATQTDDVIDNQLPALKVGPHGDLCCTSEASLMTDVRRNCTLRARCRRPSSMYSARRGSLIRSKPRGF